MKESYSKANPIVAILALIVSILAFIVPLGYTIYTDEQSKIEDVDISTSRYLSDYNTEIIQQNISGYPAILPTWYECILINKGEKPVNIIGYQLQQTSSTIVDYSHMNMGLFDKSGKQIEFPLDMEPKSSYKFYLRVGLLVDPKSFEIIRNNLTSKNETTISEVNHLLAKNGMDLYGNPVEYLESGNTYGTTVLSNRSEQIFLINFVTSDHNSFMDIFSWYKIEKDM